MDSTFAIPIFLNNSINATLLQPPQLWWASNSISTLVTAIVTILAVYLGQRLAKSAERERDFLKARREAYYEYIRVISDASRVKEWTPELVTETLQFLWKAALEAGEFGDIGNWRAKFAVESVLGSRIKYSGLESRIPVWCYKCKIIRETANDDTVEYFAIDSFYGLIEFFEVLRTFDPTESEINMRLVLQSGQEFVPIFRSILLNKVKRYQWWQFWQKHKDILYSDITPSKFSK